MPTPQIVSVVDDDEGVRSALMALFEAEGFRVACFESAEALLASDLLTSCHCVVSDVRMPGMTGIDLAAVLGKRLPDLPVILMSAVTSDPIRKQALRAGAKNFIEKPFQPDDILRALRLATGPG